jgi:hypothetical protein
MSQGNKIADTALMVPCNSENFLKVWFELLRPVHKLTQRESDVAVLLVSRWYKLKETVKDDKQLNMLLFSAQTKKEMCEELGMAKSHMSMVLSRLKQRMIIKDGKLNYRYIPVYEEGVPYRLMFIMENAKATRTDNQEDV